MRNVANWRKIAQESKDILTVCLATVIDQAMTAQKEPTWFAVFVNEDSHEKPSNRITKSTQKSVYELDIQALLKFMRYRPKWADSVLNYYGFYQGLDEFAADGQRKQLESLLDRLIVDYRNRIEAHSRAADLAGELNGQGMERIYGYEEAYYDMLRLARIFAKDPAGKTYYRRMVNLKSNKKWLVIPAAVVLVAALVAGGLLLKPKENVYKNHAAPVCTVGQITVQPVEVYYDGREIVAVCYVTNGTDKTVTDVDVYAMRLVSGGKTVAAADFGRLRGLKLRSGESGVWTFRFPRNTITIKDADLTKVDLIAFCK